MEQMRDLLIDKSIGNNNSEISSCINNYFNNYQFFFY